MATSGSVRKPRAWFNGYEILSCQVVLSRYAQPGMFVATMAVDAPDNPGAAYWASYTGSGTVTGDNGDGSGTTTLITGKVDSVLIEFETRKVTVSGRDKVGELIDTRSDVDYQDQTSEQIVSEIAGLHGLGFKSDGGGVAGMAGKTFNEQNHNFITDFQNDWDAIQQLAKQDGKHAYVIKDILYYESRQSSAGGVLAISYTPPTPQSYASGNFMRLHCFRDSNSSEGIQGTVGSYHSNEKQPNTGEANFNAG